MDENLLEKIDLYIRGKLPKDEAANFQKEVGANAGLQEAVDMARMEMDAMEYLLEEDLREQVASWENRPQPGDEPPNGGNGISPKWWLGLLALVVLVVLIYFWRFDDPGPVTPPQEEIPKIDPSIPVAEEKSQSIEEAPEEKVAENKTPEKEKTQKPVPPAPNYSNLTAYVKTEAYDLPSDLENLRKSESPQPAANALERGIKAFLAGDYKTAIRELEGIGKSDVSYERASEILPHAYFKDGQFGKAARLFKAMTDSSLLKDEPEWYWLLSLMVDYGKNKKEADALLEKIVGEEGHNYHSKAVELKAKRDQKQQ